MRWLSLPFIAADAFASLASTTAVDTVRKSIGSRKFSRSAFSPIKDFKTLGPRPQQDPPVNRERDHILSNPLCEPSIILELGPITEIALTARIRTRGEDLAKLTRESFQPESQGA
ncbi:hypothetical protein F4779DRAFT_237936 [Xylariaceae sp. FL0662B]|nr:hypothetical protein F4779DRAFT_237936 [Xylariaceae sp. FL0662B]